MLGPALALGALLGMRHALEADHLAAVASLSVGTSSVRRTAAVAAAWGVGHGVSLLGLGAVLLALDTTLPPAVTRSVEVAAGAMLVLLGLDGLVRLWRRRQTRAGRTDERHPPTHAHAPRPASHARLHRALLVGGLHGVSGTGALVLLSLQALRSGAQAFLFLVMLGLGAILGMVGISALLTLSLAISARRLSLNLRGLEAVIALSNIGIGCWVAVVAAG